ncbi:MAG: hypothetical protein OXC63_03780 [Aestuariivita sp.]|nr:hypothetical protein [Aestuariivita sp.]MCY4346981.1 hypothetical protein [Aestuariivita sp.]
MSEIESRLKDYIDVFVCCSSYEDRCLSIPMEINQGWLNQAIIFENSKILAVKENTNRLVEHFGTCSKQVSVDIGNPVTSIRAMYDVLETIIGTKRNVRVVVDITTFTHEQLLILLGLLRNMGCNGVTCLYSGAESYMNDEDNKWLSKGIVEIRSVIGFSGELKVQSGIKLVIMIGFESERAQRLIEAYDPDFLSIGIGRRSDSIEDWHHSRNKRFFEKLTNQYPNAETFEFSCNDPFFTAKAVKKQCEDLSLSPVVAPMNTKISTVGAALAAFEDFRIQLCYAQAALYNQSSYSSPGKYFRTFSLNFLQDSG